MVETDVVIVGAGPIGLFAVFELGLIDLKCHLVDILDRPGGQCTELYPEKPIYDIPGIPFITGQGLVDQLLEQIKPFKPTFHLAQMASSLSKLSDGRWLLSTDAGVNIAAHAVVVLPAAAASCRNAHLLPALRPTKASPSSTPCAKWNSSAASMCWIAGGGDPALDWTQSRAGRGASDAWCTIATGFVPLSTASIACVSCLARARSTSMLQA